MHGKPMFTGRGYIEVLELRSRHKMHNHRFRKILDSVLSGKRNDVQSAASHNRAVNRLRAASAATIELQNQGLSRFSGNGQYLLNAAGPAADMTEDASPSGAEPEAGAGMTLQQLKLALRNGPARAELNHLRRRFALANHPDLGCDNRRELLSARLAIANGLIDDALKNTRG